MIDAIEKLMVHDVAGDPITGLKWTRKTMEKISRELRKAGIIVSADTVARLVKKVGYRLRVNHKQICNSKSPDRNRQFEKIKRMRQGFERAGDPVISVDTKKKEQIGQFKNPGKVWGKQPRLVKDHDFRSESLGTGVPWGLLDLQSNRGHIFVGNSHDTAAFAVEALTRWWQSDGRCRYPHAKRLLILADNGGANGSRNRNWKVQLQTKLVDPYGLSVTVCHYPPGTSKWNPIEHRLFSEIIKNWAGEPLNSYETMLNFIRTTKTATGLKVNATLLKGDYPTGLKVQDSELKKIRLRRERVLPVWNYTIRPRGTKV